MARPARPWFRSAEGYWYCTHNGKKVNLYVRGRNNEAAAWDAYNRFRSGTPPTPPTAPATPPAPPTPPPVPVPVLAPTPQPITVAEVVTVFLADAADRVQPDTLETYQGFLNPFAKKYGRLTMDRMNAPLAESYSRKPSWNPSTRSAFLAVLVRAFRYAERCRLIDRSPLTDLKRPPVASRTEEVLLTADEHERLCAVAPPPFRTFLRFLWLTGCRPKEAAQITAADVDWNAGTVTVRQHKTAKAGKRRTLYLSPDGVEVLKELADRRPTGPLLRNRIGARWIKQTLGAAMRTARKRAGLSDKKVLYGLRHTYATDALAAGVPDATVAELLGHSSTQMLHRHYSHLGTKTKVLTEAAKRVR